MLAAQFIAWNLSNIGCLVGGILLTGLCVLAALASRGPHNNYPYPGIFSCFAVACAIFMCIIMPHMNSQDGRHHKQAYIDLPTEYSPALKVVQLSVRDHWVEFQLPQCGSQIHRYDNLRLIDGHYFFATTVVKKDSDDQDYNVYKPIPKGNLPALCQTMDVISA